MITTLSAFSISPEAGIAITALAATIGTMWLVISSNQKRVEAKLDECEEDRRELHNGQIDLWRTIREQAAFSCVKPECQERMANLNIQHHAEQRVRQLEERQKSAETSDK